MKIRYRKLPVLPVVFALTFCAWGTSLLYAGPLDWLDVKLNYDHTRYAPATDIQKDFLAFTVSFDSHDDDNGDGRRDYRRVPEWVAQHVRRTDETCLDTPRRLRRFSTDEVLYRLGIAPNNDSYRHSGFDKGHMAARILAARVSPEAARETDTVLNTVPQSPFFNQGIWRDLEELTGAWAQVYGDVWVIQGPVFFRDREPYRIGGRNSPEVAVPPALFKVVIREPGFLARILPFVGEDTPEVLAFIYPQTHSSYFGSGADYPHERFLTTLERVEEFTGLEFFSYEELGMTAEELEEIRSKHAEGIWPVPRQEDHPGLELQVGGCPR